MLRSGWMDLLIAELEITRTRCWIQTTLEQEAGKECHRWIIFYFLLLIKDFFLGVCVFF